MKVTRILLLAAVLSACASQDRTPVGACQSEAGYGWNYLSLPPPNSVELRKLTNIPGAAQVLWFEKSEGRLLACTHARDAGCTPMIYQFRREQGIWQADWDRTAKACGH